MTISSSVGLHGVNKPSDVREVQSLLQCFSPDIDVDGLASKRTISMIKAYQRAIVGSFVPDGRIDPGGATYHKLRQGKAAVPPGKTWDELLSGADWLKINGSKYPNSKSLDDLSAVFKPRVKEFLEALKSAGLPILHGVSNAASGISISATRRNKNRAFLMHYSWKVAKSLANPSHVPMNPEVLIIWDHGDLLESRNAAQEMVSWFNVVYQPALHSRHITGDAIDMDINWASSIKVKKKDNSNVNLAGGGNGADSSELHSVGKSYGVVKNVDDDPHWSTDGH